MRMYFNSQNRTRHFKWQRVTWKICKEKGKKTLRAICVFFCLSFSYILLLRNLLHTHTEFSPRFVITTDDMTDSPDTRRPIKPPDPVLQNRRIGPFRFNLCHKTDGSASLLDILRHILSNYTLSQEQDSWYKLLLIVIQTIRKIRIYYKGAPPHTTCSHVLGKVMFKWKYALCEVRG